MTIHGKIEYRMSDSGSKSEGFRAFLTDEEGRIYKLYRADRLPYGDPFFQPLDGMEAEVVGTFEEDTGYFLVETIILDDGNELPANDEEDIEHQEEKSI